MDAALGMFDGIVGGFLVAFEVGATRLAGYGLALLGVLFCISYAREFGPRLALGYGSMSEALGLPLVFFISAAGYLYVLTHLIPMTTAALNTATRWGLEFSGSSLALDIRAPSFIVRLGLEISRPIAQYDTWWEAIKTTVSFASKPQNMLVFWLIQVTFMASAVYFAVMVIEFALSTGLTYVLLPWAIWRPSESLGEFAIGWQIGCLVRALVSCAIIGVAVPLFEGLLNITPTGLIDIGHVITLVVTTLLFGTIAIAVPGRVATWASRAGLALTGHTVAAGAMTFARFGMIGHGVTTGFSRLVGR